MISLYYVKHLIFVLLYFRFKLTWLSLSGELKYILVQYNGGRAYSVLYKQLKSSVNFRD